MSAHPLGDHRHARAPRFKAPPSSSTPPPPDLAPRPVAVLSLEEFTDQLPQLLEDPPPR